MKCINNDKVDHITTARAFLEFYERYTPSADLLDSSLKYLDKQKEQETTKKKSKDYIRTWYLQKDLNKIIEAAKTLKPAEITDAWTAFRIGFAYDEQDHAAEALPWWKRAVEIWPFSLDFENKYGICLIENNRADEAKKVFEWVLTQNPNNISSNTNLGNLYLMMGNPTMAYDYMTKAQALDPDYEQNLINLAVWYHANQRDDAAKKTLEHLVKRHPTNDKAKAMLQDLNHR
jgi:tetratricopeptide (TPR) repeat protein